MTNSAVSEALAAIAAGRMVIVVDDADRENEGDLIVAASAVTPEIMAFFVRHTSGLICAALNDDRADDLDLPLMVQRGSDRRRTAFTVTVDYRYGTTTGISATDRALTAQALTKPDTRASDFTRPGHLHVLRARPGGVLKRAGHTEAAVDLARLAGMPPVGVLCEIVTPDGLSMARRPDLELFAAEHHLPLVTIADLISYRRRTEHLVRQVSAASLPTEWGTFECRAYQSLLDGETHLAMVMGDIVGETSVLVRVHSECLTGDVLGSRRCDCGGQLRESMRRVAEAGAGVVVYLRGQEGRGIGLANKLHAYRLQESGMDTVEANEHLGLPVDDREYGIGAQILVDIGVRRMRLMTNNPAKRIGLEGFGLQIVERVPLLAAVTPENVRYMQTKQVRMGHLLAEAAGLGLPTDGVLAYPIDPCESGTA